MKNSRKNMSDTGKIPLSQIERELLEQRNIETYEKIKRNQQRSNEIPTVRNKPEPVKSNQQKHKKKGCSSIIMSLVLIFTVITASSLGLIYYFSSQMQYVKTEKSINDFIDNVDSVSDNIYNLLLIGTDLEDNGKSRSDTMILVTIDKTNEKIKLTSFMRDLWVDIPGYESGRLNSAYMIGKAPLLMDTISENFDISIDNYMMVDFSMFEQLIDSFSGIDVEITEKEASFINRTTHAKVTPGINHLNGDYALIYCRIRKLDSDFMRTQRQRKVINSIIDKAKNQNIFATINAVNNILPLITTDINPMKSTLLILYAAGKLDYQIEQCRIPFDDYYSNQRINGQAVLVPDIDVNKDKLHEFIFE